MIITEFDRDNPELKRQLKSLLAATWPAYQGENAQIEVAELLAKERVAMAALQDKELVGFCGALPQYAKTGWGMHPLVVKKEYRGQKIGSKLLSSVEKAAAAQGGLTLYLGADDEKGQTSLSEGDLFVDTFQKIQEIKNLDHHPYEFYQKQGYQIVGVIPNANGWHKPDVWLAKGIADPLVSAN